MVHREEWLQAAARDGAPDGLDREGLIAWYEDRAARYADEATQGGDDWPDLVEAAWNARARARSMRRSPDW